MFKSVSRSFLVLAALSFAPFASTAPVTYDVNFDGSGGGPPGVGTLIIDETLDPRQRVIEFDWDFGSELVGGVNPSTIFGVPEEIIPILLGEPIITRQQVSILSGPFQDSVFCGAANTAIEFCLVIGAPAYKITSTSGEILAGFVTITQPPEQLLTELISTVLGLNLDSGFGNSLDRKLQNALDALDRAMNGDYASAIGIMYAFINSVEAQRGKNLTDAQADELTAAAQAIIDALG